MHSLATVAVLTSSGGAFSTTINPPAGSALMQYRYVPDGTSPLDTGADIDLVGATSGFVYLNQDNIGTSAFQALPRHAVSDGTGAALLYADAGEPVTDVMAIAGEALTFTVASGGDTKAGKFYFWFA